MGRTIRGLDLNLDRAGLVLILYPYLQNECPTSLVLISFFLVDMLCNCSPPNYVKKDAEVKCGHRSCLSWLQH